MSEKIEPALSAEEWAEPSQIDTAFYIEHGALINAANGQEESAAVVIALANDVLPDSDRRKITREKIELLRKRSADYATEFLVHTDTDPELDALADALESYLPPP